MSALETKPTRLNEALSPVKVDKSNSVTENINIQADGDDAMDLLLKLAGIQSPETNDGKMDDAESMPPAMPSTLPGMSDHIDAVDAGMHDLPVVVGPGASIADDDMEFDNIETEDSRAIQRANTPDERIAPFDAAIPSGTDLHREKRAFRATAGGDNPMATTLEAKLIKQFQDYVNEASDSIHNATATHLTPDKDDPIVARNATAGQMPKRKTDTDGTVYADGTNYWYQNGVKINQKKSP